jgi:flagellar motility protein MotE (MotC chaperone)
MEQNMKPGNTYGQRERPKFEQNLPQHERDALDMRRDQHMQNVREQPAIWQKLEELERKMDEILALLKAQRCGIMAQTPQAEEPRHPQLLSMGDSAMASTIGYSPAGVVFHVRRRSRNFPLFPNLRFGFWA